MSDVCSSCGKRHDEWPPGYAIARPDAVWALPPGRAGVLENDDFCCIDGTRCFVRGVLSIPVAGLAEPWSLAVWAEISTADFTHFLDSYSNPASHEPPLAGVLANHLLAFPDAAGRRLQVHLGSATQRPRLVAADADHALGRAQHEGLDEVELHRLLDVMGYEEDA